MSNHKVKAKKRGKRGRGFLSGLFTLGRATAKAARPLITKAIRKAPGLIKRAAIKAAPAAGKMALDQVAESLRKKRDNNNNNNNINNKRGRAMIPTPATAYMPIFDIAGIFRDLIKKKPAPYATPKIPKAYIPKTYYTYKGKKYRKKGFARPFY